MSEENNSVIDSILDTDKTIAINKQDENNNVNNDLNTKDNSLEENSEIKITGENHFIVPNIRSNSNTEEALNLTNNFDSEVDLKKSSRKRPVRKDNKKNSSYRGYVIGISIVGIGLSSCLGLNLGSQILKEQQRLACINTHDLNLQSIVDITDDTGNSTYQLNWKEVSALLGVKTNNYTGDINSADIYRVANLFIDEDNKSVRTFDEVVDSLNLTSKESDRAYKYLDDLKHYGFRPDRLSPDGEQILFIESIKEGAIESYATSKILPSITIAQAILESSWGNSNLTKEANNLFGIKADYRWNGEYVTFETNEFHNQMIQDRFRKYNSLEESIKDHSSFLLNNARYKEHGVFEAKTYKEQATALENAGYSTAEDEFGNKTYAKMLCELIRQYNLQIIDAEVINNN